MVSYAIEQLSKRIREKDNLNTFSMLKIGNITMLGTRTITTIDGMQIEKLAGLDTVLVIIIISMVIHIFP